MALYCDIYNAAIVCKNESQNTQTELITTMGDLTYRPLVTTPPLIFFDRPSY